jgi:hypothetical protein
MSNKFFFIKIFLAIVLFFFLIAVSSSAWKDYQIKQDAKKRDAMYTQILDGASTKPIEIRVDYAKQISTGSPLIFGGAQYPPIEQQDAWDKIADAGVTSIRVDFGIDRLVRNVASVENYKNNVNNIQDTKNWDQKGINDELQVYKNAKKRGMKVIAIADFSIDWLSYSGTVFGYPKDWNVYDDIIKKTYKMYRPYIDYLEIWNEPDMPIDKSFLDVTNSGLSKKEAYAQVYSHISSAIREVDAEINDGKIMPLGGPVSCLSNDPSFLEAILKSPMLSQKLDFVSYHQYESAPSESNIKYKEMLQRYNKPQFPIFLTEWSYSSKGSEIGDIIPTDAGILYAANMLLNYFHMGLAGANYHSLTPFSNNKPFGIEKNHAFYEWNNGKAKLLPLARAWRLLSNDMGLGKGQSNMYTVDTSDSDINTIVFKNSAHNYGAVFINNSSDSKITAVSMDGISTMKYAKVSLYTASADNDAKAPAYAGEVKMKDNKANITLLLPKESMIGVTLLEDKAWYDFINLPY